MNTNLSTITTPIADIPDVKTDTPEIEENIMKGTCLAVEVKTTKSCIIYNNPFTNMQSKPEGVAEEQQQKPQKVTCTKCNMKTLIQVAKNKIVCQLGIQTGEKLERYTCFNDAIVS